MRRKDRELNSIDAIIDVLDCGKIAHLAFIDNNQPYILTMNYGYLICKKKIRLYLHSANEGKKFECINNNPNICFTIAICDQSIFGDKACNYGMKFRSVVGYGKIRIVDDSHERISGLNSLMQQFTQKSNWIFDDEILNKTIVLCIDVQDISGKRKGDFS